MVVLNPPFSCRGAKKFEVQFGESKVSCSQALAFVLSSLGYLSATGQLLAILPVGCLRSEKDASAWHAIRRVCHVDNLARNGHKTFTGWSPKTVIVRITPRRRARVFAKSGVNGENPKGTPVQLFRGKISMHTLNGNGQGDSVPLVHSTEMEKSGLNLQRRSVLANGAKTIVGPCVLIQRVGLPHPSKIQAYTNRQPIALSDCLIAVKCGRVSDAEQVKARLLEHWREVEQCYGGTCARYITLRSLQGMLRRLGFVATIDDSAK